MQESYVWELYLKQDWDFFPVGDSYKIKTHTDSVGGPRGATSLSAGSRETGGIPSQQTKASSPVTVRRANTTPT